MTRRHHCRARRAPLPAAVVVLLLVACGNAPPGADGVSVTDSAGIVIVESAAAREARPVGWTVAARPDVRIGVAEGEEAYQLFRVTGAAQLPDGRVAVVNAGTQEIRFYDAQGRFLHASGRRGGGPGEFEFPELMRPAGPAGELLIWDIMANRFTLLDAHGAVLRTVTPDAPVRMPQGWDAAGAVLNARGSAATRPDTPEGVMANDYVYETVRLSGGAAAHVAELPARVYHAQIRGMGAFRPIPYDARPAAAAARGAFYLTSGATPAVHVHDSDGALVRVLRVARAPEPVRRADFDRAVERLLASVSDDELRAEWRTRFGRMPVPATAPFYVSLLVDDAGHLWAERFRAETAAAASWSVFDADGRALGTIETPAGLTIYHVGVDFLLGRMRDELGVEQVVRYRLDRTGGG